MSYRKMMARLWSHITDLRLYIRGNRTKTLNKIETEIEETEKMFR